MQVVNGRKPHRLNIPRDAVTREVADLRLAFRPYAAVSSRRVSP